MKAAPFMLIAAAVILFGITAPQNAVLMRERAAHARVERLDDSPPLLALSTVLLGGFRGLVADVLWLRASRLQDEGRYFELVQLADWITKLEPRTAEIWGFHAWNLAFNVSAMMTDPPERWRWVGNGIQLLRDEGLRYNARDPKLCFELGFIYGFKIGGATDRAHAHYKRQLAADVHAVLDGGRLPDAPDGSDIAHRVRNELHLDYATARDIDVRFGPLDWRLPETHTLYWAALGRERAVEQRDLPCERMLCSAMAKTYFNGTLAFDPDTGSYVRSGDPQRLDQAVRTFEEAMARHPVEGVRSAYVNFLRSAIEELVSREQSVEVDRLRRRLETLAPG